MKDSRFLVLPTLGVTVDPDGRQVLLEDGEIVALSNREWQIYKARLVGANTGEEIVKHITTIERATEGSPLPRGVDALSVVNVFNIESRLARKIGRENGIAYRNSGYSKK